MLTNVTEWQNILLMAKYFTNGKISCSWLTHVMLLGSFYTPWKHQETKHFQFSGGIEKYHWHEMGVTSKKLSKHCKIVPNTSPPISPFPPLTMPMPMPTSMPFMVLPFSSPDISFLAYQILFIIERPIPIGLSVHLSRVVFMIFIEICFLMFLKKHKDNKDNLILHSIFEEN